MAVPLCGTVPIGGAVLLRTKNANLFGGYFYQTMPTKLTHTVQLSGYMALVDISGFANGTI